MKIVLGISGVILVVVCLAMVWFACRVNRVNQSVEDLNTELKEQEDYLKGTI